MKLLCIDTTKPKAVICLNNDGKCVFLEINEAKKHSESLLIELETFLGENNLTIKDITHLGSVTGPGSFTGIRIGMATVKALSFALNQKIVSDNYFKVVSNTLKNGFVAIKNTSTSVYLVKIINADFNNIDVVNNEDVISIVNGEPLFVDAQEQIDGVMSYKNTNIITNYNEIMLSYFTNKVNNGKFTEPSEFVPTYAQLSQAEKNLKE